MPDRNLQFVLIDDNPMDLIFHDQLIRSRGIGSAIQPFKEAKKALDYFYSFRDRPDEYGWTVVLLDLQMPELDGYGFLKYFCEMPSFILEKSWIIIVSSSFEEADRRRFVGYDFVKGSFRKPMDAQRLEELLNDWA